MINNISVSPQEYQDHIAALRPQTATLDFETYDGISNDTNQGKASNPDDSDTMKNLKSYRYESNWDN